MFTCSVFTLFSLFIKMNSPLSHFLSPPDSTSNLSCSRFPSSFLYLSTPPPPAPPACPPSTGRSSFLVQYVRLTQQSIMLWALDAGLSRTLSFIRALKSTDHSLSSPPLAAATYCTIHHTWRMINTSPPPFSCFSRHVLVSLLYAVPLTSGGQRMWENSPSGVGAGPAEADA